MEANTIAGLISLGILLLVWIIPKHAEHTGRVVKKDNTWGLIDWEKYKKDKQDGLKGINGLNEQRVKYLFSKGCYHYDHPQYWAPDKREERKKEREM